MVSSQNIDVVTDADKLLSPALGCSSSASCSICFDLVVNDGERSTAKLLCGHEFHLDCIGSAFNAKGTMQCPNCRKVESGNWLFADGCAHAFPESDEEWTPDDNEGLQDFSYSRRPFGFSWCPFTGFTLHTPIEEAEPILNRLTNFHGSQHTATPSLARSYNPYLQASEHVGNSNFIHPLSAISTPPNDLHSAGQRQNWGWSCPFLPYNGDTDYINHGDPRSGWTPADAVARSLAILHQLHYGQSPTGESLHERMPIIRTTYRRVPPPSDTTSMSSSTNGFRRFSGGPRGELPSRRQPDHHGGRGFERERSSHRPGGSFHHRSDPSNRTRGY